MMRHGLLVEGLRVEAQLVRCRGTGQQGCAGNGQEQEGSSHGKPLVFFLSQASAAGASATGARSPALSARPRMPLMTVSLPDVSGLLSGFRHADKAALVLARQRPQEGTDVGGLEEEADTVDLHRRPALLGPVPLLPELAADVPG